METVAQILWRGTVLIGIVGLCLGSAFIIRSGYLFLTAGGNAERIREAKDILWYGVMGMAIIAATLVAMAVVHS